MDQRNDDDYDVVNKLFLQNPCRRAELDLSWPIERIITYIERGLKLRTVEELRKSEHEAIKSRLDGNRFYRDRNFPKAISCYNQCICRAPSDSEQLGMGYANRSAVSFEQDEYEIALLNIDLAKKHNYPEKLMPKLLERERNCKQRIAEGHSKGTVPCPRMNINVDVNPKIPFLAKGIAMNYDPKFGRGLVAEKDFQAGDVILDEQLEMCAQDFNLCYRQCSQCTARISHVLIPCPTCVLIMYCSVECRDLNWKLYHRFECDVSSKLCCVSGRADLITPRLFFYGLTQFGDDIQAMMKYCEKQDSDESKPLDLDYTNMNRLEVFNVLRNSKPHNDSYYQDAKRSVASYYVVFLMNPFVKSIIRTESHRQFFLRSLVALVKAITPLTTTGSFNGNPFCIVLPIGSLFNHSCDPNAIRCSSHGRVKMVLIRPVGKGEQIFTSYGFTWWNPAIRGDQLFKCQCVVCDKGKAGREWHLMKARPFPLNAANDMRILTEIGAKDDVSNAATLNALKQFMKRYAHYHPNEAFLGEVPKSFALFVDTACTEEKLALDRARLQAELL